MYLDEEARQRNSEMVWRVISGAQPFRLADVKDPFGLVLRFWDPKNTVEAHLRGKFSQDTCQKMNDYDGTPPPPEQLVVAVLCEFNQWIEGPCLYEERLFAGIELTDEALRLSHGVFEPVEKIRLNRLLLEAVCWPALARSNGYIQNFNKLVTWAGVLLVGKTVRGGENAATYLNPPDIAMEAIKSLASGKAVWQSQKDASFITYANIVIRSIVSHELEKSENKTIRICQSPSENDGDTSTRVDVSQIPDPQRDGMANVANAEYINIMEKFPEDSLERKVLEVIWCGIYKPSEVAEILGVSISEVTKAKKTLKKVLVQLNY